MYIHKKCAVALGTPIKINVIFTLYVSGPYFFVLCVIIVKRMKNIINQGNTA